MFEPEVTESAEAEVARKWPHLPPAAAKTAAGWVTLLERVDERHRPLSEPADTFAAATSIMERVRQPQRLDEMRRDWIAEREPIMRGLTRLLNLFPAAIYHPEATQARD